MQIKDRNERFAVPVLGVVVMVIVAAYLVFYGWHQLEDPENWRVWSLMAVLAALAAWYGWLGFSLAGSIMAAMTMTVVTAIDGATAPDVGGDGIWWPLVWTYVPATTAVVVVPVSILSNRLWRRLHGRQA